MRMPSDGRALNDFCIISDITTISVMIWILKRDPARHKGRYVRVLVLSTILCIIFWRALALNGKYLCHPSICVHVEALAIILYTQSRFLMGLFYVHKAHCSQDLEPVFPERYFTKIFPRLIIGIALVLLPLLSMTWVMNADTTWICTEQQSHLFSFESCDNEEFHESSGKSNYVVLAIVVVVELSLTLFFTYLYLKPLYRVWHQSEEADQRQKKLKQMMLYNVKLTFLGMITSNVV